MGGAPTSLDCIMREVGYTDLCAGKGVGVGMGSLKSRLFDVRSVNIQADGAAQMPYPCDTKNEDFLVSLLHKFASHASY